VFSRTSRRWHPGQVTKSTSRRITIEFDLGNILARKDVQWPNGRVRYMDDCASRSATEEVDPGDLLIGVIAGLWVVVGLGYLYSMAKNPP
jgi:hypothetical protein